MSEEVIYCPNCGTELLPYLYNEREDAFYCPYVECEYATIYDDRLAYARNNFKWGQNTFGLKFIGKKDNTINNNIINVGNTQNTIIDFGVSTPESIKNVDKLIVLKLNDIIGYDEIKETFQDIVNTDKPVHLLLSGAPSTAKTLFLKSMERELILQNINFHYIDCATLTPAGLGDYIKSFNNIEVLALDEIDSIDKNDQKAFLNLLENGVWQTTKSKDIRKIIVDRMRVFATCNSMTKLVEGLRSRFMVFYLKAYTEQEYVTICTGMLQNKYNYIDKELALYIAEQTLLIKPRYMRNASRVGALIKSKPTYNKVDTVIKNITKYKVPDDILYRLDVQK